MLRVEVTLDDRRLRELAPQLDGQAALLVRRHVSDAFAASQQRCPVASGHLKASGTLAAAGLEGEFGYGASYAPVVELGGHGRPARRFIGSSAEDQAEPFFAACADLLKGE